MANCGRMKRRGAGLRIAIVSDIHGDLSAFEAVLADLRKTSPDLILHGGDLADCGSSPVEMIDYVRDLGWQGVMGNTDEMLVRPETLEDFASQSSAPPILWETIRQAAEVTRSVLGEERLKWLSELPRAQMPGTGALVHATPDSCWPAPATDAADAQLQAVYGTLGRPIAIYAHTHRPSIRGLSGPLELLINTGSVGLPYDGDPRACYLLMEEKTPVIRRVEYDVEKELKALASCTALPYAEWTAAMLRTSAAQLPKAL